MAQSKSKSKLILIIVVILILAVLVIGFIVYKKSTNESNATKSNNPSSSINNNAPLSYTTPSGWAKLSQSAIESSNALSGIGRTTTPSATFTISTTEDNPGNATEIKNSTLDALQKNSDFQLISINDVQIDGQSGQKFLYKFTKNNTSVEQELFVVPYNKNTYFLLFSVDSADFESQASEFENIISSFKFN